MKKINVDEFINEVDEILSDLKRSKVAFANNMKHHNKEDHPFCHWMMMYLAWSELADEEDCRNYYWQYEVEDE